MNACCVPSRSLMRAGRLPQDEIHEAVAACTFRSCCLLNRFVILCFSASGRNEVVFSNSPLDVVLLHLLNATASASSLTGTRCSKRRARYRKCFFARYHELVQDLCSLGGIPHHPAGPLSRRWQAWRSKALLPKGCVGKQTGPLNRKIK